MGSTPRPQLEEGNIYETENTYDNPTGFAGALGGGKVTGTKNIDKIPSGKELLDSILNEMRNGLPAKLRAQMEASGKGAISGRTKSAEDQLARTFAQQGDIPVGARTDALSKVDENARKTLNDLYLGLSKADYEAMQRAFGKYTDLNQLAFGKSAATNQPRLAAYEIDKANDFSWGDALGGLFGLGGNILGGMASGGTGFFK